jgi:hypothetical protein
MAVEEVHRQRRAARIELVIVLPVMMEHDRDRREATEHVQADQAHTGFRCEHGTVGSMGRLTGW